MNGYIVVAGGINVDIKGKAFGSMDIGSSSPGAIEITPGGVGRNIAHNLALLNVPVFLLSVVGSDAQGAKVLQETSACGVNTEHVLHAQDRITGTYIALLDNTGEMTAALSDMQILELLDVDYFSGKLELLEKASYIICDANLPAESIQYIVAAANSKGVPVCLEPVSVKKAQKLRDCLRGISYITPNLDELAVLAGMDTETGKAEQMAAQLVKSGVSSVITTLGKDGLCYTSPEGSKLYPCIPAKVSDVTGAGDSLTAGFFYGLMKHGSIDRALLCGLAAAAVTISSYCTVDPLMSESRIEMLTSESSLHHML